MGLGASQSAANHINRVADQLIWLPRGRLWELLRWLAYHAKQDTLHRMCMADEHLSAAVALRSVAFFEEHAYHSDPATHWNPLFGVLGRNATQAVLSVEQGVPCV